MNGDERGVPRFDPVDDLRQHVSHMQNVSKPIDPTTYNLQQQQKAMDARKQQIVDAITKLEQEARRMVKPVPVVDAMNWVEKSITACGGENKVMFTDVTHKFIKIHTRVPMTANIFQFLPESDDNPRFHKVVAKLLIQMPFVAGVRWVPIDGGAALLVDIW
jgi:hypothetical protein